jgi:flagella basal body P-ring formation protein FlgA
MKPVLLFLWSALLAALATPAFGAETLVVPRQSIAVNSATVRLGDLFEGAGDKADMVVAYAPPPGKRAIFDARWLSRAARRYGLAWQPASLTERVVVERESLIIKREEIEDRILAQLLDQGLSRDMKVELANPLLRLHVPGDASATMEIEDLSYDPRTRRFDAIITAPAGSPTAQRLRITGRAYSMIAVPVLKRPVAPGERIAAKDFEMVKMRAEQVQPDIVVDGEALIGKTAKRGLRAGQPVHAADVSRPVVVPKGSFVTIRLQAPRMTLTAQGRAEANGSLGETIRVTNTQSNKTIEAVVTGVGQVVVGGPPPAVAMN